MRILFRRELNLVWWINVGMMFIYTVHGALLPLLMKNRGFGEGSIGFAVGMISAGSVLGFLTTGRAIDRFDKRWFILAGGLIWVFTSAAAWFAVSIVSIALLRLFQGFGYSILYTSALVYAAQSLPKDWRGRVIGLIEAIGALSIAITPLIAFGVANSFGYPAAFFLAGLVSLLIGMSAFLLPFHPPAHQDKAQAGALRLLQPGAVVPAIIASCLLLCATAFVSLAPLVALKLVVPQIGLFLGLRALGTVPSRLFSGYIADRWGPAVAILPGYVVSILAFGLLSLAEGQVLFALSLAFLFGFGMGLASPALAVWLLSSTPLEEQGVALNTLYIFSEGSGFLGAWIFGLGLEKAGLAPSLYGLCFVIMTGLCLFAFMQFRTRPRTAKVS